MSGLLIGLKYVSLKDVVVPNKGSVCCFTDFTARQMWDKGQNYKTF